MLYILHVSSSELAICFMKNFWIFIAFLSFMLSLNVTINYRHLLMKNYFYISAEFKGAYFFQVLFYVTISL